MRLIEFWTRVDMTRLDELFIRFKTPGTHDDYHLIAHRENIWLYTADDRDNEQLVADIQQRAGLEGQDLDDLATEATERGDLITGVYHASKNEFWHQGDPSMITHNPAVSQYFKKLMQFLGVEEVTGERLSGNDSESVSTMQHDMHGKIPERMHHGTNTGAMPNILKVGLVPGEGEGNWDEVGQFGDVIFLTEDFYNAKFHAERQANTINNVAPVILEVKVPDPTKIVPDFDVQSQTGGNMEKADELGYTGSQHYNAYHVRNRRDEIAKNNPGSDLSMISGIIAYQGRIPANHITKIYADLSGEMGDPDNPDYTEFNDVKDFIEAINTYQEVGYWYWGLQDEFDNEEEQEDEDY